MNRQPGEPFGSAPERDRAAQTMQDNQGAQRASNNGADDGQNLGDRASDMASEARDRASDAAAMGEERAADGMDKAAAAIRDRADDMPGGGAALKAADGMERGADYIREHDTSEMWSDVEDYVRRHPVMGIAGSVAAGFLVGRMLR